ncbi:ArsR/SmtB family transcription factor [Streptomyces paradoxus]
MELCRHLLGEPITTSELAARLGSSEPQVPRALRTLRDAGLVRPTREGKLVRHRPATDVIRRLGNDVLATVARCIAPPGHRFLDGSTRGRSPNAPSSPMRCTTSSRTTSDSQPAAGLGRPCQKEDTARLEQLTPQVRTITHQGSLRNAQLPHRAAEAPLQYTHHPQHAFDAEERSVPCPRQRFPPPNWHRSTSPR